MMMLRSKLAGSGRILGCCFRNFSRYICRIIINTPVAFLTIFKGLYEQAHFCGSIVGPISPIVITVYWITSGISLKIQLIPDFTFFS